MARGEGGRARRNGCLGNARLRCALLERHGFDVQPRPHCTWLTRARDPRKRHPRMPCRHGRPLDSAEPTESPGGVPERVTAIASPQPTSSRPAEAEGMPCWSGGCLTRRHASASLRTRPRPRSSSLCARVRRLRRSRERRRRRRGRQRRGARARWSRGPRAPRGAAVHGGRGVALARVPSEERARRCSPPRLRRGSRLLLERVRRRDVDPELPRGGRR
jgi:hypothetical protein